MWQFHFTAAGIAAVRVGYSPLMELTLRVRGLPPTHALLREARRHGDPGTRMFLEMARSGRRPEDGASRVPDLVTPAPRAARHPRIEDELAVLARTSARTVARQLAWAYGGDLPAELRRLHGPGGRERLAAVARGAHRLWRREPAHWQAVRSTLEHDIARRSRSIAANGMAGALTAIPGAAWDGDTLGFDRAYHDDHVRVGRQGLVLACTTADLRSLGLSVEEAGPAFGVAEGEPPAIFLGRRSTGPPPGSRAPRLDRADALAGLLGPVRAVLLADLVEPATTSELAQRVCRDPGTVSRHLAALHDAGLLRRDRHGRRVLYSATALGRSLLAGSDGA